MSTIRTEAREEMRGWLDELGKAVSLGLCWLGIVLAIWYTLAPTDATDAGAFRRSGFRLLTDHGTGCQYLQRGNALQPRLDAAGQPICRRPA